MLDENMGRREVLQTGGLFGSLAVFGRRVRGETGEETEMIATPEGARNVEAGLSEFAGKWELAGSVVALTRFGRFLSNKTFNVHVAGTPRAYHLRFQPTTVTMEGGRDPSAHATLVLEESDLESLLYGDYSGLAPYLAGRSYLKKDEQNKGILLALVFYVFAHFPSGANLESIVRTIEDGGLPSCEGEPPTFERLADSESDPQGTVEERVLGVHDPPDVTRQLAEWTATLEYDDIPGEQIEYAKRQLKSIIGVIYAGSTMEHAATFTNAVSGFGDRVEATVFGDNRYRTSARNAAMTNSYLAQMLEWEDWTYVAHSGAAIVPTVLAAAEANNASGKEVLTNIVAGNEMLARGGEFLTDLVNTGQGLVVHQMELPLLAGRLYDLDEEALQDAVGIAATQPQLTSFPSWTADAKGLVTGDPAYTSVRAAQLADAGLSGRRDQLENPLGYFYRVADVKSPSELKIAVAGLGEEWRFADQFFNKRYPTDGFQLTAVHAMLDVREQLIEAGIDPAAPEEIEDITVQIPLVMAASATMFNEGKASIIDRVLDPDEPDWTYTALLFDGYYPLAAALVDGELTEQQYRDDRIGDSRIRTYYEQISLTPDVMMGAFGARVTVDTSEGTFSSIIDPPEEPGVTRDSGEQLRSSDGTYSSYVACIREGVNGGSSIADEKLRHGVETLSSQLNATEIIDTIDDLESVTDINQLVGKL